MDGGSLSLPESGVRWSHVLLWGAALAISALMHAAVLERIPELPVGRTPEGTSYARTRAVRLHDVRLDPPPPRERPAAWDVAEPVGAAEVRGEAQREAASVRPLIPEPMPEEMVPFTAAEGPLEQAAPLPERSPWEPRQDILMIERRRIRDDAEALPRFLMPESPPGWELPPALPSPRGPGGEVLAARALDGLAASGRPSGLGSGQGGGPLLPEVRFDAVPEGGEDWGPEAVPAPVPTPEEAAPFEPVEEMLDLGLRLFRPGDEPGRTYFELRIRRKDASLMPVVPRDVLIMQDCSESMTQRMLNTCREGLIDLLRGLSADDRLELAAFREDVETCFGGFRAADPLTKARATAFIDRMEARGKTDVYASLDALTRMPRDPGRPLICVLITDGRPTTGLVDSSQIIEGFTRANRGTVSVFALGGGTRVNRFLLDLLSYRNRGDARVVQDRRDIPAALDTVAREISRPVMINLRYFVTGISEEAMVPETLTHLYLDRPLVLYGRVAGAPPPPPRSRSWAAAPTAIRTWSSP